MKIRNISEVQFIRYDILYFNNVVKRTLLSYKKSLSLSKNDVERNFFKNRFDIQLRDFSKALLISEETILELIRKGL